MDYYTNHDIQGLAHGMLLLTTDKSLYTSLALHPQNLQPFTYAVMHQQHNTIYQKVCITLKLVTDTEPATDNKSFE